MKAPKEIYLQINDETANCITWCEDKINDDDVQYVRYDLVKELEDAITSTATPGQCPI